MIKEIVDFAGPYRLKNLKTMTTTDGIAWTASLYQDGRKIASVDEAGHGGPIRVICSDSDLKALKTHAEQKTGKGFEPEGTFLAALADYTESVTRAKRANAKRPVFIFKDELDQYGVPTAYGQFKCPNTPQNLEAIRRARPDARLFQDEIHLW